MAAPADTSCRLVGPVPFKDVNGDDGDHVISEAAGEYADMVSTLPSITSPGLPLRLYSSGSQEAKLAALPSPRLLQTHMHHSLADNPDCKIVFVCSNIIGNKREMIETMHRYAGGEK